VEWKLDRTDHEILACFQKNARISNKELAATVGLAPSSCLSRVQRLRAEGILGEAHAVVAPAAMGIGLQALVAVRLRQHSRQHVKAFWKHALGLEEVLAVYHLSGAQDFLVHLAVRDTAHLRDLALDAFTARPEVGQIETSLLFDHAVKPVLPNLNAMT
jgi:DNA-binding Lrp family transcriptional regulator